MRICEELSDDGGLGDDLAIVDDGWDEAAGVDLQVFWRSGRVEINDFLPDGETKFGEGDVCPVRDCGGCQRSLLNNMMNVIYIQGHAWLV